MRTHFLLLLPAMTICVGRALAAPSPESLETGNLSSVTDGSGGHSTNTIPIGSLAYVHVSAAGQPGGVGTSAGGGWTHHGGFLQAVDIKRAQLDTDGDGIIDEIDADNDNDRLADRVEIGGLVFSPTTPTVVNAADSDGDGADDGAEAVAGTNPMDGHAVLRIAAIEHPGGSQAVIRWSARADGGKRYRVLAADGPGFVVPSTALATNTYSGGPAPWYQMPVAHTDPDAVSNRYYLIEVLP